MVLYNDIIDIAIVHVPRYLPGIDTAVYNVMYSSSDIDNYRIIIIDIAIVLEYHGKLTRHFYLSTLSIVLE